MPYDPDLAERVRDALSSKAGVTKKKMFGGLCYFLNGHMLCGVETGRFMFRVGKDQEAIALSRPGARPMDFTGRPLGGLVWVDAESCVGSAVTEWVAMAEQFVRTLPDKAPKKAKAG